MTRAANPLAQEAARLATLLPHALLLRLADLLQPLDPTDWEQRRRQLLHTTPQPHFRAPLEHFLAVWRTVSPALAPSVVALLLHTAASTARTMQSTQRVELIWTGPEVDEITLRRTDEALLEVIEAAQHALLIVSFAVYQIPRITEALLRAAARRVQVRLCLEAPASGQIGYDTIAALGSEVARHTAIYLWPLEQRQAAGGGRVGSLHAKCAVADSSHLFLSSANLTAYAMTRNIELGVLVQGGVLPGQVLTQFDRLIERGVLERVERSGE